MKPIVCTCCGKPLTGGIDTFSDIDHPMCWDCHSSLLAEYEPDEPGLLRRLIREEAEKNDARKLSNYNDITSDLY